MDFIRVIHQKHYDPDKGRFTRLAFRPSSDGSGISVFEKGCALRASHSICEHIERFYLSITGDPPIFWEIPHQKLPEKCQFVQTTSPTGDACHHNIVGLTEKEARDFFKTISFEDFRICTEKGMNRRLMVSDLVPEPQ
jgi:hypothetical protein